MPEPIATILDQGSSPENRRRRKILIFSMVSLLNVTLLGFLLTQLLTPAPKTSEADPLIGHPAPDFTLAMLLPTGGQRTLSLSEFKGKAVVLNFWASWCAPCKEEMPLFENTWKQMQAQGKNVFFLGIDFQESNTTAIRFLQQNGITYPAVLDASGSAAYKYRITSLPDTIFINHNGTVISKESREITAQILSSNLQLIL